MGIVTAHMSMSVDGYVAGPNAGAGNPLGDGGVLIQRWMFDEGEGPWGDNPRFRMPVFVLTHEDRDTLVKEGGTTFTFVTDGIKSALEQAKAAAGDKNVNIAGGADTVQQFIRAGLLDELEIHLAPLLFGEGIRLF